MMQTIYSRYSRSRRPEYQIATFIEVDGAYNVVRKKALTPVARPHILRMISNYQVLCDIYGKEHVAAVQMEDEDTVRFDFVEGVSWGARIADIGYHQGKQEFFSELRQYYHFLEEGKSIQENNELDFSVCTSSARMVDIDLHPDNILYTTHGPVIIDYEWLYPDAPLSFVFQRSMMNFYYNSHPSLLENVTSLEEIWNQFGVTQDDRRGYRRLEKAFSDAVGADVFMNRFQKKNIRLEEALSFKKQARDRIYKYISKLAGS